ncbi:MAG TPA: gamma-glutamyl-gamma-aminobutyrate hydrolase family protein [Prolixibacteraceae bacterium]|nr:gamma-glutamyl-gamma-aminobutyrate hydrolase family protein [Prolixibacteraceae bacterium]
MKHFTVLLLLVAGLMTSYAQQRLPEPENPRQMVILLANPTVGNIETIRFLVKNSIFKVKGDNTIFWGFYHKNQAYDFTRSKKHIEEQHLNQFRLYELTGDLPDGEVFRENSCSSAFLELFRISAGVIFFGGPDIQPDLYGEENTHSIVTDPARHAMETSFLFHLLGSTRNPSFVPFLKEKPEYLVTGFCLGLQTMNVATGGTLVQDIPFQLYGKNTPQEIVTIDRNNLHRNYWQEFNNDTLLMGINLHTIDFTDHPFFSQRVKVSKMLQPRVYSSHHQSIENLGQGFAVTALSPDGKIIEGIAHREYPHVFAVQFHPEVPALYRNREAWKFEPTDTPGTYHRLIGPESVRFHKKYWKQIAEGLRKSWKKQ